MTSATVPKVMLVGAGPGDPELLTIKAVKALRQQPAQRTGENGERSTDEPVSSTELENRTQLQHAPD